ncbi:hypothetical protein FG379_001269 [Cryptosporidium bovis]|uniref:uncharacterized protein n=1 Tax=Cryptosporidium bovis TaxID=310047 RepID=UPI00351A2ADA|nr:hypothetical protein FG379_001269 [Cryptosporidium bovis]
MGEVKRVSFEIDDDELVDDICLLKINTNFEPNKRQINNNSSDFIYLCEVYFDNNTESNNYSDGHNDIVEKFLVKVRISGNVDNENESSAENCYFMVLHKGFGIFKCEKYVYIRLLYSDYLFDDSDKHVNKYIDICFSGPLFLSKYYENTSIYMLNYKNLLVNTLKRQFYLYVLPILKYKDNGSLGLSVNYERVFNMKNVSFVINEQYYHFKIIYIKLGNNHFSDNKGTNFTHCDNDASILPFLNNVLLVPKIERDSTLTVKGSEKEEVVYSSTFKETIEIVNYFEKMKIPTCHGNYCKCTLYIDIAYLLKRYVMESDLSKKLLDYIYEKIAFNISTLLNTIFKLNRILKDYKIFINICFYNFKSTFKKNIILKSQSEYLNKIIYIEYDYNNTPNFCSLLNEVSDSDYMNLIREHKRHNYYYYSNYIKLINTNNELSSVENELYCKHYLIYVTVVTEISRIGGIQNKLLIKNYNMFLRLLSYIDFYSKKHECSDRTFIDTIAWIIRHVFSLKSGNCDQITNEIIRIITKYGLLTNTKHLKNIESSLNKQDGTQFSGYNDKGSVLDKFSEYSKNSNLSRIFDEIIEKINNEIRIHMLINNNQKIVHDLLNQVYVSRILVYRDRNTVNRLYFLKKNIYSFIKNNNSHYSVVYRHTLTLISPYFGQSELNIRKLFDIDEPTILFLDGIDIIASTNKIRTNIDEYSSYNDIKSSEKVNFDKMSISNLFNVKNIKYRINYHKYKFNSIICRDDNHFLKNKDKHTGDDEGYDHHQRTVLTTLLLCLDNIEKRNQNAIVIAFSNKHVSDLDDSITRAGRFDIHIPI